MFTVAELTMCFQFCNVRKCFINSRPINFPCNSFSQNLILYVFFWISQILPSLSLWSHWQESFQSASLIRCMNNCSSHPGPCRFQKARNVTYSISLVSFSLSFLILISLNVLFSYHISFFKIKPAASIRQAFFTFSNIGGSLNMKCYRGIKSCYIGWCKRCFIVFGE